MPKPCACGCGASVAGTWRRGHNPGSTRPQWIERDMGYVTPCWLWQRAVVGGYGRLMRRIGASGLAHRVIYERERGAIPTGLVLDHLCEVGVCVNPDHLEPVTQSENTRRGAARARRDWAAVLAALNESPFAEHRALAGRLVRRAELSGRWRPTHEQKQAVLAGDLGGLPK